MILFFASAALASNWGLALPEGPLRPHWGNVVEIAGMDDAGVPVSEAPQLFVDGRPTTEVEFIRPGVWQFEFAGPEKEAVVSLRLAHQDHTQDWNFPVEAVPNSLFTVEPVRVRSSELDEVSFLLKGVDSLPVEALDVTVPGGQVVSKSRESDNIRVVVALPNRNEAHVVPVGFRDHRTDTLPLWTHASVSQGITLKFVADARAVMKARVGGRSYGPFTARDGVVSGVVEQRPGEKFATIELSDDLGNVTTARQVLPTSSESTMAFMTSQIYADKLTDSRIFIRVSSVDGRSDAARKPSCRTPVQGNIELFQLRKNVWMPKLSKAARKALALRLVCTLGSDKEHVLRLSRTGGVASRLKIRAFPDEVSTDFPVSEVQVQLEDDLGDRLSGDRVQLSARHGAVKLLQRDRNLGEWEYQGNSDAIVAGSDALIATYRQPMGTGAPVQLQIGHTLIPSDGNLLMFGRALNSQNLPLPGVMLHMTAGDDAIRAVTGADGWARASVSIPKEAGPVILEVRSAYLERQMVVLRGAPSSDLRPDKPDLLSSKNLRIRAGRVSKIVIDLDSPVIYASSNGVVRVRVQLLDAANNLVDVNPPSMSASEGTFGPIMKLDDGLYEVEFTPQLSGAARTVLLTAKSPNGAISIARDLKIEPVPVTRTIGLAVGAISNFGRVTTLNGAVDFEQRIAAASGRFMLRAGISGYSQGILIKDLDGSGEDYRFRLTLIPISVGVLLRQDIGMYSVWGGVSAVFAPGAIRETLGTRPPLVKGTILPPGLAAMAGVSRRLVAGELTFEIRGLFLHRPANSGGLQGQVGGLNALLGYRFIFD